MRREPRDASSCARAIGYEELSVGCDAPCWLHRLEKHGFLA